MEKFRINIASPPDREYLVAEIFYDNMYWAEISQETGELVVQFYEYPKQKYWEFSFDDAFEVLQQAKEHLLDV